MSELLTLKEVAEAVKVSPQTVSIWIAAGKLPGIKLGGAYPGRTGQQWRVRQSDLDEFLRKGQRQRDGA